MLVQTSALTPLVLLVACQAARDASPSPRSSPMPDSVAIAEPTQPLSSIPEVAQALAEAEAAVAAIVAVPDGERTFANSVLAIDDLYARLGLATDYLTFMAVVSPDAALRERGNQAQRDLDAWSIALGKREDLYRAVRAAAPKVGELSPEHARFLEFVLRDYRRAGMDLDPASRAQLLAVELELSELELAFQKNIRDDDGYLPLTRAELAGLPDSWFSTVTSSGGLYLVTLDNPTYTPVMRLCEDATTRQKLYLARRRRAAPNVALLDRILALRVRQAELLGYAHPADFETEIRMSGDAQTVSAFYADLRPKLRAKAESDYLLYRTAKREHTHDPEARLEPWDEGFYRNRLLEQRYAVDEERVREYLSIENATRGLFSVTGALFGIEYRDITESARTSRPFWHPDVKLYAVHDATSGALLGEFYLDLHPRPNKFSHAAQFTLRPRKRFSTHLQTPLVALVCNFTKPTPERPALLSHSETTTFFHEFGHCLHAILAEADTSRFAGSRVARDFVEAPSQMLENWLWDPDILRSFALHYQTREPLPEALLAGLLAAKNLGSGLATQNQLFLGVLDQTLHTSPPTDTVALSDQLFAAETLYHPLENTFFHAAFGHLVGYQAGYYGYLWAEVFAQDMFGRFREHGLLSPEAGAFYRRTILAPGGSRDELQLLHEYLGRAPNSAAFLESLGLPAD